MYNSNHFYTPNLMYFGWKWVFTKKNLERESNGLWNVNVLYLNLARSDARVLKKNV